MSQKNRYYESTCWWWLSSSLNLSSLCRYHTDHISESFAVVLSCETRRLVSSGCLACMHEVSSMSSLLLARKFKVGAVEHSHTTCIVFSIPYYLWMRRHAQLIIVRRVKTCLLAARAFAAAIYSFVWLQCGLFFLLYVLLVQFAQMEREEIEVKNFLHQTSTWWWPSLRHRETFFVHRHRSFVGGCGRIRNWNPCRNRSSLSNQIAIFTRFPIPSARRSDMRKNYKIFLFLIS